MIEKLAVSVAVILLIAPFYPAESQQAVKALPRIGFIISTGTAETPSPLIEAFRQGMRDLGYLEGKNYVFERRYAEGRMDRMSPLAQDLVQQKVDVIVGVNNAVIRAAKEATKTIPIVMLSSLDPVATGYIESFAHPGGNITGLAWLNRDISPKRLELLKDLFPKLSQAAVLWDADGPGPAVAVKEYIAAAKGFKFELRSLEIRGPNPDFPAAFHSAKSGRAEALIVVGNPLMSQHLKSLFPLAIKYGLPSITEEDRYVEAGGLISYGASFADLYRRAAEYVVDILKGGNPATMRVRMASKFEIFINLKTAKQLGVVIPEHVLVQADKVIK